MKINKEVCPICNYDLVEDIFSGYHRYYCVNREKLSYDTVIHYAVYFNHKLSLTSLDIFIKNRMNEKFYIYFEQNKKCNIETYNDDVFKINLNEINNDTLINDIFNEIETYYLFKE